MTPESSAAESKKDASRKSRKKRETPIVDVGHEKVESGVKAEAASPPPIEIEYQCIEHVTTGQKDEHREEQALQTMRRHIGFAMAGSLIPLPIADKVAVSAVEVNLLREISEIYKVPFSDAGVAKVIAALAAGLGSMELAKIIATSGVKAIPFIGHLVSALTYPVFCGALTYALGKVFIMHYELGGTLLSFDAEGARNYFAKQFHEGKLVVAQFQNG